ncbi:MAG: hypothetical protein QOG59_2327 [Solirubrobacteraceae bacterium]|nr:hypothetical protein [Solirubrobacteraceae bacterium]
MRIYDYLEYWADSDPERVCIFDGTRAFTYSEINEWADRVAVVLADLGLGDGDRFGVLAKNCVEWAPIYYGAFKAGAVPVPLNFRLNPREWVYLLGDANANAVLVEEEYMGPVDGVRLELSAEVTEFVAIGKDAREAAGWRTLSALAADVDPHAGAVRHIRADHDLWQMYTSGTTGRPKGAVLTHAAVNGNVTQIRTSLDLRDGDNLMIVTPLYHAGAAVGLLTAVACGASVRVVREFDPADCVRIMSAERITCANFVPAMIQEMLLRVPDIKTMRFDHLRTLGYGASPIHQETLRSALEVFGCDFIQGFGQTETSALLTILGPAAHRRALAGEGHLLSSCGRPILGTEVAVVNPDGDPVQAGEVGEIVARGPQMMREYWNLPDATKATFADGWLNTGDVGRFDDEGFLYITDRLKDMIVSGGENIYPREIESVIFEMPGVADVAVIGVPDERWGETVKAIVVAEPGQTLTDTAVIDWCRSRLAGYKSPRSVDIVDALPRNATGKILKNVIRKPFWEGSARQVG